VISLLNTHFNEIIRMPDVVEKMASFGARPAGGAPDLLSKVNAEDLARLTRTIRDLNITAD
jgi:hypothetical protein